MNLQVTGLHMEVGDSLRDHCATTVKTMSEYFPDVVDVNVQFKANGHEHQADVKIHASQIHLRAQGEGEDFYASVDAAVGKLLRQLKKYKGRIQKHRRRRDDEKFAQVEAISAIHNEIQEAGLEDAPESAVYAPNVEKREVKSLQTLTVDEAVMQMDLMHLNIYLFQNITTGHLNVVYREDDGKIGWVETDKMEKVAKAS